MSLSGRIPQGTNLARSNRVWLRARSRLSSRGEKGRLREEGRGEGWNEEEKEKRAAEQDRLRSCLDRRSLKKASSAGTNNWIWPRRVDSYNDREA